jgi:ribonuclease HI
MSTPIKIYKKVDIYMDGSCLRNGQPGAAAGWSFLVDDGVKKTARYGKLPGELQTNNRAELYGLYMALRFVRERHVKARLLMDSKLIYDGLAGAASRKANRDLWDLVEDLCAEVNINIESIKHISREENELADKYARKGARALIIPDEGLEEVIE